MSWPILALVCALCQALADVFTRRFLAACTAAEVVMVRLGLTAILLLPLVALRPPALPDPAFWGWVGLALPLELLAMVLYMTAIRVSPLALTLPYLAFTPVFSALFGWLVLGEQVSLRGLGGVLLVVIGTWALNLERPEFGQTRSWLAPLVAIGRERGSRLMLAVALIYSLTSVLGKGALQHLPATVFGRSTTACSACSRWPSLPGASPGPCVACGSRPGRRSWSPRSRPAWCSPISSPSSRCRWPT